MKLIMKGHLKTWLWKHWRQLTNATANATSVSIWKEISFQKEIWAFGRKFGRK
jgi:hypothetical protein